MVAWFGTCLPDGRCPVNACQHHRENCSWLERPAIGWTRDEEQRALTRPALFRYSEAYRAMGHQRTANRTYSNYVTTSTARCNDCRRVLSLQAGKVHPLAYSEYSFFDEAIGQQRTVVYCKECTETRERTPGGENPKKIVCIMHKTS